MLEELVEPTNEEQIRVKTPNCESPKLCVIAETHTKQHPKANRQHKKTPS